MRIFIALAACLISTACASKGPTTTASAVGAPARGSYAFADEKSSSTVQRSIPSLESTLQGLGFRPSDTPTFLIEVAEARSIEPASVVIPAGKTVQTVEPAQPFRLFGRCRGHNYRLTLAMTEAASGTLVYRGTSEMHVCDKKQEIGHSQVSEALVAALAQRFSAGQPVPAN